MQTEVESAVIGSAVNPKLTNVTLITLKCGHKRSLGGHILNGKKMLPSQMLGCKYECKESYCINR